MCECELASLLPSPLARWTICLDYGVVFEGALYGGASRDKNNKEKLARKKEGEREGSCLGLRGVGVGGGDLIIFWRKK